MDPTKCKKEVYPNDKWGSFHGHQCTFNIWKDGFCKKHHPDSVKAREEASSKRWDEKWEKNPIVLLKKANERIVKLEAEVARLRKEKADATNPEK